MQRAFARRKREPLSPEQKKRRLKRRLAVYGVLLAGLFGAYRFQPIEVDLFPIAAPPYRAVDPDATRLFARGTRVLIIAGHPDDSEFYAGGTLALLNKSGAELAHLLHTDGDKAYYFWADQTHLRQIRREEQTTASKMWGAKHIWFLGYPDGRLRNTKETVAATVTKIREFDPDYVFMFDPLYPPARSHQDHRRSGEIALAALKEIGFEGWMIMFSTRGPNFVVDIDKVWADKLKLLEIHKSQFFGSRLKFIQDHRADAAAADGELAGFSFGEAFRAVKL